MGVSEPECLHFESISSRKRPVTRMAEVILYKSSAVNALYYVLNHGIVFVYALRIPRCLTLACIDEPMWLMHHCAPTSAFEKLPRIPQCENQGLSIACQKETNLVISWIFMNRLY